MPLKLFTTVCVLSLLQGCASLPGAQPWERGNLAKPIMSLDTDSLDSRFVTHIYDSKESSSGGMGVGGGGCGCN